MSEAPALRRDRRVATSSREPTKRRRSRVKVCEATCAKAGFASEVTRSCDRSVAMRRGTLANTRTRRPKHIKTLNPKTKLVKWYVDFPNDDGKIYE
ncbi:hypothetical protein HY990_00520 [Candidatus Micrarchaeota archaeon]|nr:hypothetical protein [Candidatus Micrarchaeota archaeon]